ncbi:hypothetical protein P3L51_11635 [Streptomyces sp. PSRA5]|uniref:hypothetical protein n=1 Tax=Streptomyces panacea TaxID=3035064 RepID=UPI00339C6E2D
MLLRPGKTCDEALAFLKTLTEQGLNDVQNSVPHLPGGDIRPSIRNETEASLSLSVDKYDRWTLEAIRTGSSTGCGPAGGAATTVGDHDDGLGRGPSSESGEDQPS